MEDHEFLFAYSERGDSGAFAELVRRYEPIVRAAARRQLADAHLAEDITQSTMMTIMRKARQIPRSAPLGPWLLRVTHNLAVDSLRSETARKKHERLAAMQRSEMLAAPIPPAWRAYESILDETLHTMGIDDRTILTLRYLQGQSIEEISRELDLTPEATRQRLSRALRRLRTLLTRSKPREDEAPAVAPPLAAGVTAVAHSWLERLLLKATSMGKSVRKIRTVAAVTGAVAVVAGPAIVVLIVHHRAKVRMGRGGPPIVQPMPR
jgi:RNA polymerase sigma-70 factor (ECF subfamily)